MREHNAAIGYVPRHASSGVGAGTEPGELGAVQLGVLKRKGEDEL